MTSTLPEPFGVDVLAARADLPRRTVLLTVCTDALTVIVDSGHAAMLEVRHLVGRSGARVDDASRVLWDRLLARLLHDLRAGFLPT